MLYWIIINGQKLGPLTLDETLRQPLQPETLVWHQGLPSWLPANRIKELMPASTPATLAIEPASVTVVTDTATTQTVPPKPPTYLVWSIVTLILFSAIPAIVALVYALKVTPSYDRNDFDTARKASSMAEIWVLVSIALGTMLLPFQMLIFLS